MITGTIVIEDSAMSFNVGDPCTMTSFDAVSGKRKTIECTHVEIAAVLALAIGGDDLPPDLWEAAKRTMGDKDLRVGELKVRANKEARAIRRRDYAREDNVRFIREDIEREFDRDPSDFSGE